MIRGNGLIMQKKSVDIRKVFLGRGGASNVRNAWEVTQLMMLIENCSQNCYGNIRNSHTYVICLSGKRSLNSSSKTIENYYCVSRTHPRVPLSLIVHRNALLHSQIYIYIFFIGKTVYFEHMDFISRTYFSYTKITIHRIYLLYKNTKERKLITEQLSLFV